MKPRGLTAQGSALQFAFLALHTGNRCRSMELRPVICRGPHDRQGAKAESATAFCPGQAIGPRYRPRPRHCAKARTAPPRARPARESPNQDRDATTSPGRPTIPSRTCCWASGRTTASPAENQAPHPEPADQGDLVMIRIALNGARRKGPRGRFTCGITPSIGKWAAPAASEVAA